MENQKTGDDPATRATDLDALGMVPRSKTIGEGVLALAWPWMIRRCHLDVASENGVGSSLEGTGWIATIRVQLGPDNSKVDMDR
jgi:hypothetical protein